MTIPKKNRRAGRPRVYPAKGGTVGVYFDYPNLAYLEARKAAPADYIRDLVRKDRLANSEPTAPDKSA